MQKRDRLSAKWNSSKLTVDKRRNINAIKCYFYAAMPKNVEFNKKTRKNEKKNQNNANRIGIRWSYKSRKYSEENVKSLRLETRNKFMGLSILDIM